MHTIKVLFTRPLGRMRRYEFRPEKDWIGAGVTVHTHFPMNQYADEPVPVQIKLGWSPKVSASIEDAEVMIAMLKAAVKKAKEEQKEYGKANTPRRKRDTPVESAA